MAAILITDVSKTYYLMLRGQTSMYLPPYVSIIAICNIEIQNDFRIDKKVIYMSEETILL